MLVIVREGDIGLEESIVEQRDVEKMLSKLPEIESVFQGSEPVLLRMIRWVHSMQTPLSY